VQPHTTRINPSEEAITIGPLSIRFLITGEDSRGCASVFEFCVPAGQKLAAPAHCNDAYEEIVYGIEGVLTWTVDGMPIEVGPGQALCIPRGAVHRFDNLGSEDVSTVFPGRRCRTESPLSTAQPSHLAVKYFDFSTRQAQLVSELQGISFLCCGIALSETHDTLFFSGLDNVESDIMLAENFR
jgi:quercetin dioxygenase-like cupin family protein